MAENRTIGQVDDSRDAQSRHEADPVTKEMLQRADAAASFIRSLANPQRLAILCALELGRGELSVTQLEDLLGIRQPTLSQQLARLREDRLVAPRRDGKSVYYRIASNRAGILVMLLYEWFRAPEAAS